MKEFKEPISPPQLIQLEVYLNYRSFSPLAFLDKGKQENKGKQGKPFGLKARKFCCQFHFQMRFKAGITFLGNGNMLCLDRSLNFADVHICQDLENGHLRFVCFIVEYFPRKYRSKQIAEISRERVLMRTASWGIEAHLQRGWQRSKRVQ